MDLPELPGCADLPFRIGFLALAAFLVLSLMGGVMLSMSGFLRAPQPAPVGPAGPGQGIGEGGQFSEIPPISDRYYSSGDAQASVSGAFQLSGQIALDQDASYSQDGLSWISFIDNANPGAGEILVVFGEPENSVTVAQGTTHAIGQDDDCTFDIQVTASSVGGSISCASVNVLRGTEPAGTSVIQLRFSTRTYPMDGGEGAGTGDEGTPPADQ